MLARPSAPSTVAFGATGTPLGAPQAPTGEEPLEDSPDDASSAPSTPPLAGVEGLAGFALVTVMAVAAAHGMIRFGTPTPTLLAALGFTLAVLALVWVGVAQGRLFAVFEAQAESWPRRASAALVALAPLACVALAVYDRRAGFWDLPDTMLLIVVIGGIFSVAGVSPKVPALVPAVAAIVVGVALRQLDFARVPISANQGDMLPLIIGALDRLRHGQSPYGMYHMPWEVPLTYLPGTWLAFAPARLLGVDPRWTTVACQVGLLGVLLKCAGGPRTPQGRAASLLFASWFLLGDHTANAMTAMPIQTCMLGVALAMVAVRSRAQGPVVGVALATTPLAAALLPLIAARWWTEEGRAVWRRALVAAAIACALLLPWVLWSPAGFWSGRIRWFNNLDAYPRQMWNATHAWAYVVGFSGFFWTLGWERWLRVVQVVIVASLVFAWVRQRRTGPAWASAAVATYVGFVLFNVIVWPYLYQPAAALAMATVVSSVRDKSPVP